MDCIASLCVSAAEDPAPVRHLQAQPRMSDAYDDSPLFAKRESNQRGYRDALKFSMRSPWIFSPCGFCLAGSQR